MRVLVFQKNTADKPMSCRRIGGIVESSPLLAGAKFNVLRQEVSVLIIKNNTAYKGMMVENKNALFQGRFVL